MNNRICGQSLEIFNAFNQAVLIFDNTVAEVNAMYTAIADIKEDAN